MILEKITHVLGPTATWTHTRVFVHLEKYEFQLDNSPIANSPQLDLINEMSRILTFTFLTMNLIFSNVQNTLVLTVFT